MKQCNECGHDIDYRHDDACAVRHPIEDYDLTQPTGPVDVGKLGESAEDFEKKRIAQIRKEDPDKVVMVRGEITEMVRAIMAEATGGLRQQIISLQEDVSGASQLMHMMDVPMEAIAESHERASKSFETLRRDILGGGLDKLEKVLDTAGLTEAASKTERRLEQLVQALSEKVDKALTEHSKAMVQVLHLLERMHSRELNKTKKRAKKVAA